jgi:hypothetical protein
MAKWTKILREAAQRHTFLEVGRGPDTAPEPVEPGSGYVSVVLRAAQLSDSRRGLDRLHAVVHSVITIPSDVGPAEFSTVIAPPDFTADSVSGLERFIRLDHRLLGPVPYIGGALEIQVGLFAVPGSELAQPYIKLLQTLGEQAVLPFVSAARPFIAPLVQGINLLAGGGRGTTMEIGFDLTQAPARRSRIIALGMPHSAATDQGVRLADDGVSVVDRNGRPLTEQPALVVEVYTDQRRPDWPSIPELAAAYERVRNDYRAGRRAELDRSLEEFRRTAVTCVDLLMPDRRSAVRRVQREIADAGPPSTGARGTDPAPKELRTLDQLALLADPQDPRADGGQDRAG